MVSFVQFSAAIFRKIWAVQKKRRIVKRALILTITITVIFLLWWYYYGKERILLLLAPGLTQLQVTKHCWKQGLAGVGARTTIWKDGEWEPVSDGGADEVVGLAAAFDLSLPSWSRACDPADATGPLLLVLVASTAPTPGHPNNARRRNAVRRGWAAPIAMRAIDVGAVLEGASDPAESARMLFLVGTVEGYSNEQNISRKRLDWEKGTKKDIIQVALGEGKAPPAYQHVMALKWMVERCPVARYLLKVDDDVYVNLRDLLRLLQEVLPRPGAQGLLLCHELFPDRATGLFGLNGWLVPRFEKPYYCSGKAVLYSNDVVTAIYDQVVQAKRFPRKESLLTGKIRQRANITILPLKTRSLPPNTSPEFLRNALWSSTFGVSPPASRVLFAHQPRSADDLDWLWSQAV